MLRTDPVARITAFYTSTLVLIILPCSVWPPPSRVVQRLPGTFDCARQRAVRGLVLAEPAQSGPRWAMARVSRLALCAGGWREGTGEPVVPVSDR